LPLLLVLVRREPLTAQAPIGGEFLVNTATADDQYLTAAAMDADGRLVVTWTDSYQYVPNPEFPSFRTIYRGLYGRGFTESGRPYGPQFGIATGTTLGVFHGSIAADGQDRFVVTWDRAHRFDGADAPAGDGFEVGPHSTSTGSFPSVAADAAGGFVIAWRGAASTGQDQRIMARRFGPEGIFADGFESGTLSAWSATAGGGDLVVSPEATMGASAYDLQGNFNDTQPLFVQDDSPRGEHRYRARFYFDPGDFDPGEAQGHFRTRLFIGFEEEPQQRRLFALVLRRRGGAYALMARARADDNAQVSTEFVPITAGPHAVEIAWTRATGLDSGDGSLELWVDGTLAGSVATLDNDRRVLDFVRLGALSLKSGASGTLSWDEFESRRASAVGP
jgi:hypothetical protein